MKLPGLNLLLLCMAVLVSPSAQGALLSAESGRPPACDSGQSKAPLPLAEKSLDNFPILLAGAGKDQCLDRCNSDLQPCVDRCPGFDESNVVDPKFAARKCKNACDAVLSQCKSECPKD